MADAIQPPPAAARLADLLRVGDELGALRLWQRERLADDPALAARLGRRMAEIAARLGRPGEVGSPLERLQQALANGDTETLLGTWIALRGSPDLPLGLAGQVNASLERALALAARRALGRHDDDTAAAIGRAADAGGVVLPDDLRRATRAAARRARTRRELDAAIADEDRAAVAALGLSGRLDDLGRLPSRVDRAIDRATAWPHLRHALAGDDDAAILAAYDPDLFDDDPALPEPDRARIDLAQRRVAWLHRVRAALRRRDARAVATLTADPPAGARARLSDVEQRRLARLVAQDGAVDRLVRALHEGPDEAVVAALNAIGASGAALPEDLDWSAVRGVVDRLGLAHAIRDAAADPPDHARLARLLPAARAVGLSAFSFGPGTGGIDFDRLEADLLRAGHLARLRDALATDDDRAIALAARPDPHGAIDHLTPPEQERVRAALRGSSRRGTPTHPIQHG